MIDLDELKVHPRNRLEVLKGNRKSPHGIRINDQYRICFIWLEEFLEPLGIAQRELADAIHVPYQRVNEIVNQRRGVTPVTALRFAKYFGVSPEFWLNLQMCWDLYHAQSSEKGELKSIIGFHASQSMSNKAFHQTSR